MAKPLRLMITCDDAGLSQGIDTAILELYQQGMISAASLMGNMPNAANSLRRFTEFPQLEIGAHLNLTEGVPLTDAMRSSSFVAEGGRFKGRLQCFVQGLFLTNPLQTIVFNELDAQMQVFTAQNLHPAHITTHHHFHMLPEMRRIVYELARKYNVHWVRNSRLGAASIPTNPFIQRHAKIQAKTENFIEPDYVVLVQEWQKQAPQALLSELRQLNGLIEVVIHPSTETDETFPDTILYKPEERYREVQFLQALWMISRGEIEISNAIPT